MLRLREHLATDSKDPAVIEKAQQLDCLLLSVNGDFADIVKYPPRAYRGIISLQIRNHPEVLPLPGAESRSREAFSLEPHRARVRT